MNSGVSGSQAAFFRCAPGAIGLDGYEARRLYLCAQGKSRVCVLAPNADVAQLAEQRFCKPWVAGSSPIVGSALAYPSVKMRDRFSGQIPKWPTGADCKSAGFAFGSSNLSLPTLRRRP